jgi:hypothetical protein
LRGGAALRDDPPRRRKGGNRDKEARFMGKPARWVMLGVAIGAAVAGTWAGAASAATDRLPDLGMARLSDFRAEKTSDGRRLLQLKAQGAPRVLGYGPAA